MDLITQSLEIRPWPVTEETAHFFGFIVAIGIFPEGPAVPGNPPPFTPYADFVHRSEYSRYRLPEDPWLFGLLYGNLQKNIGGQIAGDKVMRGNLLVTLGPDGYAVDKVNEDTAPGFEKAAQEGLANTGPMAMPRSSPRFPDTPDQAA